MPCVCEVPLHQPQDRQTAGSGRAVSGIHKYRRFDHGARMPPAARQRKPHQLTSAQHLSLPEPKEDVSMERRVFGVTPRLLQG